MNPFSKAKLDLPNLATVRAVTGLMQMKDLIFFSLSWWFPAPLDLSLDSLVTVLISDDGNGHTVSICQSPIATDLSRGRYGELAYYLEEIELFDGNLYGIASCHKLLIFEISGCPGSNPKIASVKSIIDSMDHLSCRPHHLSAGELFSIRMYLVKCDGRLLIVERWFRNVACDRPTSHGFLEHFLYSCISGI